VIRGALNVGAERMSQPLAQRLTLERLERGVGASSVDQIVIDGYPVRLFTLNLNQDWRNIERNLLQLISKRVN
jgi:hypothetical protein